ncbi:MAG: protein kinase domain-containing protein [Luteolibacter sp.]
MGTGGWPKGVMPVVAFDFRGKPSFFVSELVADGGGDAPLVPRSLQQRLDDSPGLDAWKTVKAIAGALAAMHARHVPHGNLKPGNVFFDTAGGILLRDWALGHMPGIEKDDFTDALLYQPPEQLRDAAAYTTDGFRCDVFAFGVLAFRLLTGTFPRCHATFYRVAPAAGKTRTENIRADLKRIAANLETQNDFRWPADAADPREMALRGWIERCLALNPADRPHDMGEVAAGLTEIRQDSPAVATTLDESRDEFRPITRRARRSYFGLAGAAAMAVLFAALWQQRSLHIEEVRKSHDTRMRMLLADLESQSAARSAAETMAADTADALVDEREIWLARLQASELAGDRLFAWLMEDQHRHLPPLDGRELRLRLLDLQFGDFLKRSSQEPELVDERAMTRLRLAEISLSLGEPEEAASRLDEATKHWQGALPVSALALRLAADRLWLAMVFQEQSKAEAAAAFAAAREALAAVPRSGLDTARLDFLLALLDLHESRMLAARGDETRALEQLMRATQTLNHLSGQRPDAAVLRSEVAACHLSTANILDGIGNPSDALEVRALALAELEKALEKHPNAEELLRRLAAAHTAMAEAAVLSGDPVDAVPHIAAADKLVAALPASHGNALLKASLLGLRAGILRDRGKADEAMPLCDEGIRALEGLRAAAGSDPLPAYRLALLWWQKARLLGDSGRLEGEIEWLGRAHELLESLVRDDAVLGPLPEQILRTSAYLAGDLGHALQIANRKGAAAQTFDAAVSLWEKLAALRPDRSEYQEGLTWSRQRRSELK